MLVSDFFPYWDLVEVEDAARRRTLAFDVIQQLVCSASRRFEGNASSAFGAAVCVWRQSVFEWQRGQQHREASTRDEADVCTAGGGVT